LRLFPAAKGWAAQLRLPSWLGFSRWLPLLALMVLYAVHFGSLTVDMLRSFQQDAYDLAVPDQGIWLLSHFHAPFVTVMGKDMFGDHTSFIFLLLVPVYWAYPHTAVLLVAQAMALASAAVPIYLLSQFVLKNGWLSTLLAGAYLLNPAIQQGNLEQFHVEAFEVPLLAWAIYAAIAWRPWLFAVAALLLLLCKQDDALYAVPLGAWVAWRRDRTAGLAVVSWAVAVALAENFVLVPLLLNGIPTTYGGWWPFGSLSATLRTLVRQPGQFWAFATSQGRPFYVWQMLFSTGVASLAAPGILLVAVPELLADTLSSDPYLHQLYRHYSMPVATVLVCAGIYAIGRWRKPRARAAAAVTVSLCALWSCVLWGAAPFSDNAPPSPNPSAPAVLAVAKLIRLIPPGAVVSAEQSFVPNIDHRRQIYLFPTPFSQSYYGNPKNDGHQLRFANQVQYLLLPNCIYCDSNLGQSAQSVFDRVASRFRAIGRGGGAVLYERTPR
jgi:uncharacterized membrane protein